MAGDGSRQVHVVVVEDNVPDVMLIGESLNAQAIPYKITHYRDGVEAVEKLLAPNTPEVPDVIVLDLNMPRMGGLEVLVNLKRSQVLGKVPVAILTSSLTPEEREDAHRLGASRFLRKPVDLDDYLNKVGGMLKELLAVAR